MDRTVRRLAAILAADVVGYSRKMEADERSTLAALKDVRTATIDPLLAEHSGRIIKTMGDGFIAEFGSVVDAVAFAVAMQKAVLERQSGTTAERRLVFRIGINLGDVVVENDDLLGDGVNVAARLEQLCAPGGVMISGTAFDQLQGKLGLPLDFAGEQHVKNISRPVRTYVVRLDGSGPGWYRQCLPTLRRARPMIAAGLIAAVVAGGTWGTWWYTHRVTLSVKPSIAVMPFENLGGDASSDRLARGITEDIVTDFSRFRDIDVIASFSTEAYHDKSADTRQIAKDLNVRYVLKGSIQREGDQIRVNTQLFDGTTGVSVWSNRWDRPAVDFFAVQNEIADRVMSALAGAENFLTKQFAAAARRKAPTDLTAYDLFALGVASFQKGTEEGFLETVKYNDEAIAKDPQFARAYVMAAYGVRFVAKIRHQNWDAALNESFVLARKAVEIDPNDAAARALLGDSLMQMGDPDQAMVELDRALELNPSSANIIMELAYNMSYLGRPEEGATLCDRGFRLNPSPPPWYPSACEENYFFMKRYRESIDMMKRTAAWTPLGPQFLGWLAAAQIEFGAVDDAAATVTDWKRRFPDSTVEGLFSSEWAFRRKQERDQVLASLQKAGAPICVPTAKLGDFPKLKHLAICDEQRAKEATR
jgi:TolB-like protein/class 3 adenylate cyclase/Tfp pilus assembly protein PilF